MQNTPTRRYRHYKGGEYEWLCEATYEPDPARKETVSASIQSISAKRGTCRPSTSTISWNIVDGRVQIVPLAAR